MAILALSMVALLQASQTAIGGQVRAKALTLAIDQAEARLETVGREMNLRPGKEVLPLANGWQQILTVQPIAIRTDRTGYVPYLVQIEIVDRDGVRLIALNTVRLGRPQ